MCLRFAKFQIGNVTKTLHYWLEVQWQLYDVMLIVSAVHTLFQHIESERVFHRTAKSSCDYFKCRKFGARWLQRSLGSLGRWWPSYHAVPCQDKAGMLTVQCSSISILVSVIYITQLFCNVIVLS